MKTLRLLSLLGVLFISLDLNTVSAFNVNRDERQWGMYKSFHDMLPKGKHSLNLGLGNIDIGVNEDGTISLGGKIEPIKGVSIGGEIGLGGNEEQGLGFRSSGSASLKNEALGLDTGLSGGYEGHIKGLEAHHSAHGEAGVMVGGVGVHGGLEGASGIGLSTSGLSTHVSAGGNAGADVKGLAHVGAGAGAGVGATLGPTGVSGNVNGGVNAAAGVEGLADVGAGVHGGVGAGVGLEGISGSVEGGANAGAGVHVAVRRQNDDEYGPYDA